MERDPRSRKRDPAPRNDDRGALQAATSCHDARLFAKQQAKIFRDTVEGHAGKFSVALKADDLVIDVNAIPVGAVQRPELVVDLLRSDAPLTPELRQVIADMVDPGATSDFCFENFARRRGPGRPAKADWLHVGYFIQMKIAEGVSQKEAVYLAREEFGIKRSSANKHLTRCRDAFKVFAEWQGTLRVHKSTK